MEKLGVVKFDIPPRSPDINPIENVFNLVERKLQEVAIEMNIRHEKYPDFVKRVSATLLNYPVQPIDNIIRSMNKRMHQIVEKRLS